MKSKSLLEFFHKVVTIRPVSKEMFNFMTDFDLFGGLPELYPEYECLFNNKSLGNTYVTNALVKDNPAFKSYMFHIFKEKFVKCLL